jgi:Outer membrane protein beta-barrel domain
MKKIIFAIFSLVFFQNFVSAQRDFRIGIFGGATYSSHKGTNSILDNTDGSFVHATGGFSVEYVINEKFSIKTGLGFEKKRIDYFAQTTFGYFDQSGMFVTEPVEIETKNEYNYLTIPLLVKYNFGPKKSFFANLGSYMSIQTNHEKGTTFNYTNSGNSSFMSESGYNFPLSHALSSKEYGVSLGLGKSFVINKKNKISFELRNNFGLTNRISNYNYRGISGDIKTNTINLLTEFSFGL